ncbi:hypothetical protein N3Z16_10370 (plasmid) [Candidatus Megaera polyxenophila]|uniref:hypothetical protein n=1 Tax=Candidatus Megaera polyxenophila TaxID=988779 RepID=UPI00249EB86C|nr:hypothetical protein N3Z16_10370 [Candidatus Megaera polyxenophila]
MSIEAIYPKMNLSKRNQAHKVYPYLLKGVEITKTNQVWSTDITYIRMAQGFVYLLIHQLNTRLRRHILLLSPEIIF